MLDYSQLSVFFRTFQDDILGFLISVSVLILYHVYLRSKVRKDPTYTVQAINRIARRLWVETLMNQGKPDVIAVQTLRNSTMAATFLASTAVLLIMGVLTMSSQSQGSAWQVFNSNGANHPELWLFKLMLLLINLFVAFFSFAMSIRVYNHVGFQINVPLQLNIPSLSAQHIAAQLNSAGKFYSIGMRTYYYCVPLVFWLFGPHLMVLATMALIPMLYKHDRAPKIPDAEPRNNIEQTPD